MPESMTTATDERAAALLRVEAQKFMAVAEARAEMRRTLGVSYPFWDFEFHG